MILAWAAVVLFACGGSAPKAPAPVSDAPPGALVMVHEPPGGASRACWWRAGDFTCPDSAIGAFPGPPDPAGDGLVLVATRALPTGHTEEWLTLWSKGAPVWRSTPRFRSRNPAWAPDGQTLVYEVGDAEAPEIWRISRRGVGAERVIAHPYGAYEPQLDAAGRVVYAATEGGNAEVFALQGPDLLQLTRDPADDIAPAPSPLGDSLAFLSTRGGLLRVWIAAPDGSTPRPLTAAPVGQRAFAWAPDGHRLAVVGEDGSLSVYRAHDGARLARLDVPGRADHPAWSANAEWVAATVETPEGARVWAGRASGRTGGLLATPPGDAWLPRWVP